MTLDKEQIVLMPSAAVCFAAEPERGLRERCLPGHLSDGSRQARYGLLKSGSSSTPLIRGA